MVMWLTVYYYSAVPIYDLSVPISGELPTYPSDPAIQIDEYANRHRCFLAPPIPPAPLAAGPGGSVRSGRVLGHDGFIRGGRWRRKRGDGAPGSRLRTPDPRVRSIEEVEKSAQGFQVSAGSFAGPPGLSIKLGMNAQDRATSRLASSGRATRQTYASRFLRVE